MFPHCERYHTYRYQVVGLRLVGEAQELIRHDARICRNSYMPTDHGFVDDVVLARFSRPLGQLGFTFLPKLYD